MDSHLYRFGFLYQGSDLESKFDILGNYLLFGKAGIYIVIYRYYFRRGLENRFSIACIVCIVIQDMLRIVGRHL
jgi:hypothetical protein